MVEKENAEELLQAVRNLFDDTCYRICLAHCRDSDYFCDFCAEKDCFLKVIDAVKKRIPMKPLHKHKNYYCPICGEYGWVMWDDALPTEFDNFCCVCGQALDWSDLDEAT